MWKARYLATVCMLLFTGTALSKPDSLDVDLEPGSRVHISITPLFSSFPPAGMYPVRVEIENDSGRERKWQLTSKGAIGYQEVTTTLFRKEMIVPDGQARTFECLLPIAPDASERRRHGNINITMTGYGLIGEFYHSNYAGSVSHGKKRTAFVGVSDELYVANWSKLEKKHEADGYTLEGEELSPKELPGQSLAYAGFGSIWFSEEEWQDVKPKEKGAVMDYVAQGGSLVLVYWAEGLAGMHSSTNLISNDQSRHGFGTVTLMGMPAGEFIQSAFEKHTRKIPRIVHHESWQNHKMASLFRKLPEITLNSPFIITILVIMAFILGPINLFYVHKKKNPTLLLLTTPLLSFFASIILFSVIVLQDGFGGQGNRLAVHAVLPDEHKEITLQQQFSLTGVLTKRDFSIKNGFLLPQELEQNSARIKRSYRYENDRLSGSWFSSRAVQGHFLSQVNSSRGRMMVTWDGKVPVVLSHINSEFEWLCIKDKKGRWWLGENVGPGQTVKLKKAKGKECRSKWKAHAEQTGGRMKTLVNGVWGQKATFYGLARDAQTFIPTLKTIEWKDEQVLYFGAISEGEVVSHE